jgi:hypothetical protein
MIAKKKNKKADLEGKRFAFFQIGLVVAGSLCLAAFEYSTIQFSSLDSELKEELLLCICHKAAQPPAPSF